MAKKIRRYVVNLLWHHLFHGTLCHLAGRHRALVVIGDFGRRGFRTVPLHQCAKCRALFIKDVDALRIGGRA